MGDCRELMSEYNTNEEDELNLLKNVDKKLSLREIETAKLRMAEKKLIGATMTAVRKRLAPIRGIPTKQGMEDPNQDLLDIFSAIESIPNKPKEMFQDFKKWARGDYEDEFNRPKGGGGCG
jgi:protein-histidine N-methyltransferase